MLSNEGIISVIHTGLGKLFYSMQPCKLALSYWVILHILSSVRKQEYKMNKFSVSKIFALQNIVMILE